MRCRLRVPSGALGELGARKGGAGGLAISVVSVGAMSPRNVAGMAGAGAAGAPDIAGDGAALDSLGSLGRLSGRSSCGLSSAAVGCCREGVFCIGSAWRTRRRNDGKNDTNERNDNDTQVYRPVAAP